MQAALTLNSDGRYTLNLADITEKRQAELCACELITKEVDDLNTAEESKKFSHNWIEYYDIGSDSDSD